LQQRAFNNLFLEKVPGDPLHVNISASLKKTTYRDCRKEKEFKTEPQAGGTQSLPAQGQQT
jgi:hypothetical protein